MAMQPFGPIDGTASPMNGFLSCMISVVLEFAVGLCFDGTVRPVLAAYVVYSAIALLLLEWAKRGQVRDPQAKAEHIAELHYEKCRHGRRADDTVGQPRLAQTICISVAIASSVGSIRSIAMVPTDRLMAMNAINSLAPMGAITTDKALTPPRLTAPELWLAPGNEGVHAFGKIVARGQGEETDALGFQLRSKRAVKGCGNQAFGAAECPGSLRS